ncbi:MAG: ATP-dependent DNA ligase, partial [Actinobacteria bacterium]|nr:ATP-dependent DNA ligase [Actinomycetota bacterium]
MLLAEVVDTVAVIGSTPSRLAKIEALAALLARLERAEIAPAVGFLLASPRQGRLGVGWRGLAAFEVAHATSSTLTLVAVDEAFDRLAAASGTGSQTVRADSLHDLAARATAAEWEFLTRVLLGELRTGALEGVMLDAVARASERPIAAVRRAAMLSGDLGLAAVIALIESVEVLDAVGLEVGRAVFPMLASTASTTIAALAVT